MAKGVTTCPEEVGREQKTVPCGNLSGRVALGLPPNSHHHLGCTQALGFESEYADLVYPISAVWEELEKSTLLSFFFSLKNFLTKLKPCILQRISCLLCGEASVYILSSSGPWSYCARPVSLWVAPPILIHHLFTSLLVLRFFCISPFSTLMLF